MPDDTIRLKSHSSYDLVKHIERQWRFSQKTFGPKQTTEGVIDHIRKELEELDESPRDIEEWVDVIFLALDGACRSGATAGQITAAIEAKLTKNEKREWPNWREHNPDKGMEHVKVISTPLSLIKRLQDGAGQRDDLGDDKTQDVAN